MAMKISVAMCTYDGARYLGQQLDSIAAQTRPPDELVVCDDGSTDGTREIVESFAADAPFAVRLHINEQTLGSTKNFGRAIGLCAGEIIALSDQDDVWLPGKLDRLEAEFLKAPGVGLVFSDAEVIDENSRPLGYRLWEKIGISQSHLKRLRSDKAVDELLPGSTVTGTTMAFRSGLRDLVLPIPDDLPLIHDGWVAVLTAAVTGVSFVDEPLVRYRRHPRQQVGPLERKGGAEGGLNFNAMRAGLRRLNPYEEALEVARAVHGRLSERRDVFDCGATLSKLESRIEHLEMRANLPAGRLRRAGRVLKELLTRRYHHHSRGVYSAVKDLLA